MRRDMLGIRWPEVTPGTSVPRILHQNMLKGWDSLPPEILDNIDALKARNPGWEYRFYDDPAARDFILRVWGPKMLAVYESIDPVYYAARSDLLRYLITYVEGGVYLDIKSTALRPLDQVIRPDDVFILSQWPRGPNRSSDAYGDDFTGPVELAHIPGSEYVQWFIVTAPGHPFLAAVLKEVVGRIARYNAFSGGVGKDGVVRLTGPTPYTLAIDPLRASTLHRAACFDADLDFIFSIYGKRMEHRKKIDTHYTKQTRPIIRRDPVTTIVTKTWFGKVMPRMQRLRRQVKPI